MCSIADVIFLELYIVYQAESPAYESAYQRNIFYKAQGFDIFCMVETFVESRNEVFLRIPDGFEIFTNPALRNFKTGRAAGGILILLRTSLFLGSECKCKI